MTTGRQPFSPSSIWKRNTEEQSYKVMVRQKDNSKRLQQKAAGERVHELNEWRSWLAEFFHVNIGADYLGLGSAQPHICCFRVCTQPMSRIGWKSCM